MNCKKESNANTCTCSYEACGSRGLCCDCLRQHLAGNQLPGCCFPPEAEKNCDRSFKAFAKAWKL